MFIKPIGDIVRMINNYPIKNFVRKALGVLEVKGFIEHKNNELQTISRKQKMIPPCYIRQQIHIQVKRKKNLHYHSQITPENVLVIFNLMTNYSLKLYFFTLPVLFKYNC